MPDPGEEYMNGPMAGQGHAGKELSGFFQGLGQALFGWGAQPPAASTASQPNTATRQGPPPAAAPNGESGGGSDQPAQNQQGQVDSTGSSQNSTAIGMRRSTSRGRR